MKVVSQVKFESCKKIRNSKAGSQTVKKIQLGEESWELLIASQCYKHRKKYPLQLDTPHCKFRAIKDLLCVLQCMSFILKYELKINVENLCNACSCYMWKYCA